MTTTFIAEDMRARGYQVLAGPEHAVRGGAADSRKVEPGDVFTAFHGEHTDGNAYVAEALQNGAVAAICERAPEGAWPDKTIVVAPSSVQAVGQLAHAWRKHCNPRVVGITGTVGKTTAKDLVADVLGTRFRTHRSPGNLNSREGLPLALMSLRTDHEVSVLEMAMDSPGEILELCEIAEPEIGVVLGVGLTHVSKLGSIEAIAREKLSLARYLPAKGTAVLNADDPWIEPERNRLKCRVITFCEAGGHSRSPATLKYSVMSDLGLAGTRMRVFHLFESAEVHSPLPGRHTIPAAISAIGAGIALGMTFRDACAAVGQAGSEGRLKVHESDTGATILDDRYNSSPASLAGALRMLKGLPGRHIALLGTMAELGDFEEEEHRKAGQLAAECCDVLVAAGEPCRVMVNAARAAGLKDAEWFDDKRAAAVAVRGRLGPGDYVLVKASRSQEFETIIPFLEGAT